MFSMATKILPSSSHGFQNDFEEIIHSRGNLNGLVLGVANKTRTDRQESRETYIEMYKEDLISHFKNIHFNHLMKDSCKALTMWMLDPHERDATVAREALGQGDEVNYNALLEIFVGRKSSHIVLINQVYKEKFKRNLDQDIINIEPPQPFQKILVALAASHKAHHEDVSQHIAKCDARRLFETGEGLAGGSIIEEAVVLEIFSKRSIPQLKLTFSSYKNIYGHDFTKSLTKENLEEFESILKTVIKCMCNPPKYYAKTLYTNITRTTKDEATVARVMMTRADIDLDEIQKIFKKKYGIELKDAIRENIPSGVYKEFLTTLALRTTPK